MSAVECGIDASQQIQLTWYGKAAAIGICVMVSRDIRTARSQRKYVAA